MGNESSPWAARPRSVPLGEREGKATALPPSDVPSRGSPLGGSPPHERPQGGCWLRAGWLLGPLWCLPSAVRERWPRRPCRGPSAHCRRRHPETRVEGTLSVTRSEMQTWGHGRPPAASAPGPPTLTPACYKSGPSEHTRCKRLGPAEGDVLHVSLRRLSQQVLGFVTENSSSAERVPCRRTRRVDMQLSLKSAEYSVRERSYFPLSDFVL